MQDKDALSIIEHLSALYPRRLCAEEKRRIASIWLSVFRDEPAGDVWRALVEFIKHDTSGFMPLPAKIYEIMTEARAGKAARETEHIFTVNWTGSIGPDGYENL